MSRCAAESAVVLSSGAGPHWLCQTLNCDMKRSRGPDFSELLCGQAAETGWDRGTLQEIPLTAVDGPTVSNNSLDRGI